MTPDPDLKWCKTCDSEKPIHEFRPTVHGTRGQCRSCEAELAAERRTAQRGGPPRRATSRTPAPPAPASDDRFAALIKATTRRPMAFGALCDVLDMAPGKLRALIDEARENGYAIRLDGSAVGIGEDEPDERVKPLGIAPTVGRAYRFAHLSDTHFGSVYCMRDAIRDFVRHEYERGVRVITHSGDFSEGDYKHARFELSHVGGDEQARDAFETLPELAGLRYIAIGGNHDWTYTSVSGIDAGQHFERYFREHGRHDLRFLGNRSAHVELAGARIHLWHPRSGGAYAVSYPLQKKVEAYQSGEKPHILLAGHWHKYAHIFARGVHAIAAPTMQARAAKGGRASQFSASLAGAPSIGGLEIEFTLTEHRTMRDCRISYRAYYQREKAHLVDDDSEGIYVGSYGGTR